MRQDINILWLDDELDSDAHEERKFIVSDILEYKGYKAVFKECSTFENAIDELVSVKRYDFFISDFNLEKEETGLTYLEKIRESNGYRQFVILYSNNEYSTIKDEILNVVRNKNIGIFSNFTFFSVGDQNEANLFENAIDVILCRWDELNAIRGRFMFENAKLEHILREKLIRNMKDKNPQYIKTVESKEYRWLVREFFNRFRFDPSKSKERDQIQEKWLELVDKRNLLAHSEEKFDAERGYYIYSKDKHTDNELVIYEDNLDDERKYISKLVTELVDFVESGNLQPPIK
ncbi:response regulator [Streptococcus sp. sy004]|uniref:response regulator n=1 Tax=Streptococcus sp. sy004 TaxID=2600149 RepID=UPI0011B4D530|nr:response regulator [Streptococcus sp. sy004]TWT11977.1 response regulator [Streptococcus sp. sy004]